MHISSWALVLLLAAPQADTSEAESSPNRERGRLRVQSTTAFVESLSGREAEGSYEKEVFREAAAPLIPSSYRR